MTAEGGQRDGWLCALMDFMKKLRMCLIFEGRGRSRSVRKSKRDDSRDRQRDVEKIW